MRILLLLCCLVSLAQVGQGQTDAPVDGTTAPTTPVAATNETLAPTERVGCWDNLTDVFYDLLGKPAFSSNEYVICPGNYSIGYDYGGGNCCIDGMLPLVARTNTVYKCGEDGSSSNGCYLTAGTTSVLINDIIWYEDIVDCWFEGFHFHRPLDAAIIAGASGGNTFKDCILEGQQNEGPVLGIHYKRTERHRRALEHMRELGYDDTDDPLSRVIYLMSHEYIQSVLEDLREQDRELEEGGQPDRALVTRATDDERNLQQGFSDMFLTFEECVFRDNKQGTLEEEIPTYGIITIRGPDTILIVKNCIFENNVYTERIGYAISALQGSDVLISNSCFINNNFLRFGTVELFEGASFLLDNNYGTPDSGVQCDFAATSDVTPTLPAQVTCEEYDATTCLASIYEEYVTTQSPTQSPTETTPSDTETGPPIGGFPVTTTTPATTPPSPTEINGSPNEESPTSFAVGKSLGLGLASVFVAALCLVC